MSRPEPGEQGHPSSRGYRVRLQLQGIQHCQRAIGEHERQRQKGKMLRYFTCACVKPLSNGGINGLLA